MVKSFNKKKLNGFSLLELLVTMGILMLLSLMVFPLAINKTQESKLESYASQLITDLYYQQNRCKLNNVAGGVSLGVNTYTLYYGDTLATSTDTDTKKYPSNIRITSIALTSTNEITFPAGEFKPSSFGTLRLTDGTNSIQVYINKEGLIGYEKL